VKIGGDGTKMTKLKTYTLVSFKILDGTNKPKGIDKITAIFYTTLCITKTSQKGFSKFWEFFKVKFTFEYFIWLPRPLENRS